MKVFHIDISLSLLVVDDLHKRKLLITPIKKESYSPHFSYSSHEARFDPKFLDFKLMN